MLVITRGYALSYQQQGLSWLHGIVMLALVGGLETMEMTEDIPYLIKVITTKQRSKQGRSNYKWDNLLYDN